MAGRLYKAMFGLLSIGVVVIALLWGNSIVVLATGVVLALAWAYSFYRSQLTLLVKQHVALFDGAPPRSIKQLLEALATVSSQKAVLADENYALKQRLEDEMEYAMAALTNQKFEKEKSQHCLHNSLLAIEEYLGDGFHLIDEHAISAQQGNVSSMGPKVMLGVFTSVASQVDFLRRQMYDYLPAKREHIGGATIAFDELEGLIRKGVKRFGYNKAYTIGCDIEVEGVDPDHIIFHDMNYLLRMLYFLCEFLHTHYKKQYQPPRIVVGFSRVGRAKCEFSLQVRVPGKGLLPRDFNTLYSGYFWSNIVPKALVSLHGDLVAALKMSAYYSINVSMESDDLGNDTLSFRRVTFLSKSMDFFKDALELRRRIPASDVFFVTDHEDPMQERLLSFIGQHSNFDCSVIKPSEFSPGIVCRASRVILSATLSSEVKAQLVKTTFNGPFVRIKFIFIDDQFEDYEDRWNREDGVARIVSISSRDDDDKFFDIL